MDHVALSVQDGVGLIELARPDELNVLGEEMLAALEHAASAMETNDDVRVVVLTGRGRAFCAGADMGRLRRLIEGGSKGYDLPRPGIIPPGLSALPGPPETVTHYSFPMAMSKPVIAAINGPVVGAGFVLAASCDVLFAGKSAFFSGAFGARGLMAESALAWLLVRQVGLTSAADILLSGRRIMAEEALAMRLVSRVIRDEDLVADTLAYAVDMARTVAPRSLRIMKRQLQQSVDQTYAEATCQSYDLLMEALDHPDFREGVDSFLEKRDPRFTGR